MTAWETVVIGSKSSGEAPQRQRHPLKGKNPGLAAKLLILICRQSLVKEKPVLAEDHPGTGQSIGSKTAMKISHPTNRKTRGFTLTELMIAVSILGLVSAIIIPSFFRAKLRATNATFVANVKEAANAFEMYAWEKRGYPSNSSPGVAPDGMDEYLTRMRWSDMTPLGGQWNWDRDKAAYGYKAGIGVFNPTAPEDQFVLIDEMIDDGDLSSGYFRSRPNGYVWIIEQ